MASIPTVLVVDQDPDACFQMQRLVQEAEFEVTGRARPGTEAVALAAELRPEVILCGLKEPVARVTQTIESLVYTLPQTPVVVYSESSELDVVRRAMQAGARDLLRAPFRAEDLRRALAAALESEERRRLRETGNGALGPQGTMITVCGAKGGVGKTTVAMNLAVALARHSDQSTVLVDADDAFGDVAASLSLKGERTIVDALGEARTDGADGLRRALTYHASGLAVLPGPASPFAWRGITPDRVRDLLRQLARQFDVVVADTGNTLSDVSLAALEPASLVLWVTTPEYASVHDSLQALGVLRGLRLSEDRVRVVLNIASSDEEVRPESVEEALACPIFWTVPYDRALRRTVQLGQALVEAQPGSTAGRALTDLALLVSGASREPRRGGVLQRLFAGRDARSPQRSRWREARA